MAILSELPDAEAVAAAPAAGPNVAEAVAGDAEAVAAATADGAGDAEAVAAAPAAALETANRATNIPGVHPHSHHAE
jgi:hypothetical protein